MTIGVNEKLNDGLRLVREESTSLCIGRLVEKVSEVSFPGTSLQGLSLEIHMRGNTTVRFKTV